MQGKVEISGVNSAKLTVLKSDEMTQLLQRCKQGDEAGAAEAGGGKSAGWCCR